jgi:hypothetical protein
VAWDGIRAAKALNEADLFARANVVGVAVGHKVTRGAETDERCVVVFVDRKYPAEALRRRDLVPAVVDGVRTDVVETGRFRALGLIAAESASRTTRLRPAPGGVSIAHYKVTAGTLGVLAQTEDGRAAILSNNHVLANSNDAILGDPILQPGPADGGRTEDTIAKLGTFVPLRFLDRELGPIGRAVERGLRPLLRFVGLGLKRLPSEETNTIDAAVAWPIEEGLVSPEILDVGRVSGTTDAELGLKVKKSGRTTGLTRGRINALDAVVQVDYGGKTAVFRRQVVSDLLSRGGDSGSLVVDEANRAVGLLFGGSAVTTLMNPIDGVLTTLGLSL